MKRGKLLLKNRSIFAKLFKRFFVFFRNSRSVHTLEINHTRLYAIIEFAWDLNIITTDEWRAMLKLIDKIYFDKEKLLP